LKELQKKEKEAFMEKQRKKEEKQAKEENESMKKKLKDSKDEQDKLEQERKKLLKKVKKQRRKRTSDALEMKNLALATKSIAKDSKANRLARERLMNKRLRDLYRDKDADFHLKRLSNQFPFINHFFGGTGDLLSTCGETRCRCGFYKLKWTYKDHCYLVEGECQTCDEPDEKKVKAIGFTYKYFDEVKKRLPVFTYRRRGKQWHNEPKEKSVCPKGKIVTGVKTTVAKSSDTHRHSMKIKCGPGKGVPDTAEEEKEKMEEARKKEEAAKKAYEKDEQGVVPPTPSSDSTSTAPTNTDPTKCMARGKSCECGFTSLTFVEQKDNCFVPQGDCNECGSASISTAVQAVGFDYVYNDAVAKELPKFAVRKLGGTWTDPVKQFQCKDGYIVNGVWLSADKDKLTDGPDKKKRDQYFLSITCRKSSYSPAEKEQPNKKLPEMNMNPTPDPEKEETSDTDGDADTTGDPSSSMSGPVSQHQCAPAVSECRCGFSFVAWRKIDDCYQLQGECLECGLPGAVNAIGYNYKFNSATQKSEYRWRYRTQGKLWAQPERRYTCREGKIVTNIATSAVQSGKEEKYHLWMKCNDPTPTDAKVTEQGLVAWYKIDGYDDSTKVWKSSVGDFEMKVFSDVGLETMTSLGAGAGANVGIWQMKGTRETKVGFGEILAKDYTVCTLSRYTNPEPSSQKRILVGTGGDWAHGHWFGKAGVAIYGTWVTRTVNRVDPNTDWLFMCGQNAQRSVIRANGKSVKKANGGKKGPMDMQINKGGCCEQEASDWAVAEIITWDRFLTFTELMHIEAYFEQILKEGNKVSNNDPVELSMEVAGVDATNYAKVCDAIAANLGGTASNCVFDTARRNMYEIRVGQTPAAPKLTVHISGVNHDDVQKLITDPNFVSTVKNLPAGATLSSVKYVPPVVTTTQTAFVSTGEPGKATVEPGKNTTPQATTAAPADVTTAPPAAPAGGAGGVEHALGVIESVVGEKKESEKEESKEDSAALNNAFNSGHEKRKQKSPKVLAEGPPVHLHVDIDKAVSEVFDKLDSAEVALADVEPEHHRSAAQRTEEDLVNAQLNVVKLGSNIDVGFLQVLAFGLSFVGFVMICLYYNKDRGDSYEASYYDSLSSELHALE